MKYALAALLFLAPFQAEAVPFTRPFSYPLEKTISLDIPEEPIHWVKGWEQRPLIAEFIPEGEHIDHWSHLLTFQWEPPAPYQDPDFSVFVERFTLGLVASYGARMKWKKIYSDDKELVLEWWVHPGPGEQHEIFKLFRTEKGFLRVAYTTKKGEWSADERRNWQKAIEESRLEG
ncbi:MAG: hypothetical protein K0S07_498 [Chlamydiales bacterium]|jgi:hypothetical protein|nr:hypothetical protein [Chlamydiales bacterium]